MYGNSKYQLQQIPDVQQDTPYNHFGKRKRKEARIMLTIKRDMAMQQLRKETVEHPFGTIKWYHGAHYFLCRGEEKVTAEIALSFTGYNMRRAINMIGVPGIVMHLRAMAMQKAG